MTVGEVISQVSGRILKARQSKGLGLAKCVDVAHENGRRFPREDYPRRSPIQNARSPIPMEVI
jgi:hypothetical protein